jgi:serine/threonine protein kinase
MQCLEDDTVVAWLSGSLAPELGDVIEAHVDRCSACRSLLAALTDAPAGCGESDRPWKQMPWAIGSVIDGLYRVERILGSGATSVVAAATRFADDQNVALKFMHPFERGSSRVTRFLEEARAAARLRGSHSCKILSVGELSSGRPYLVL